MPDLILLPFPGLGTLALSREQLDAALETGRALQQTHLHGQPTASAQPGASTPRLVTAEELESNTGVPSSWWMTQARERRIPFRKLGRRVRFVAEEVLACEAFRRRIME